MKMPCFSKRVLAVIGITLIIALSTTCFAFENKEDSVAAFNDGKYLNKISEVGSIPVVSLSAPARQLKAATNKSRKSRKDRKSKKATSRKTRKTTKKTGKPKSKKTLVKRSRRTTKKGGRSKKTATKKKSKKTPTKKRTRSRKTPSKKRTKSKKTVTKKTKSKRTTKKGTRSRRTTKKGTKSSKRRTRGTRKSGKRTTKGKSGRRTRSKKRSSNPFNRMSGWFKASKKSEPVKVEARTTTVRTVKSKEADGKTVKKVERRVVSHPEENADILTEVRVKGQSAEPYRVYLTSERRREGPKDVTVETEIETHHRFVEQPRARRPATDETAFTFYDEDETVRDVEDLTNSKEAKLVAMLIESPAENASPILRQSLESIRVLKYNKSARKDCPNVVTTTGWCSATCGAGERYKFKLWWDEASETCKKETLVQDCVVVSGCQNPEDKWSILQVSRPDYLPGQAYLELANALPEESDWKKDITTDGYVFYSFRTKLSGRYCPFSGVAMDDDECGIAYRYYYTQFLDRTGDSIVARGGFDRVPDIVACETADKQQQLTQRQQQDLLTHFLDEYADETDEAGPIADSLRELQIVEYQANELHPMCPSIATNQSSCSSNGCGHGRKYSLTSRYSSVTEVCQTLRQEPCLLVSGCENASTKWQLLEVEKPDRVPNSVFLALGDMIPSESEWEKVRTKKGNVLRVGFGFSTQWSQRFSPSGKPMGEDQCGPAQRWRYVREYSEADDAILQDFVVADASIPCSGENATASAYYDEQHIRARPTTLEAVVEEIMPASDDSLEESAEN